MPDSNVSETHWVQIGTDGHVVRDATGYLFLVRLSSAVWIILFVFPIRSTGLLLVYLHKQLFIQYSFFMIAANGPNRFRLCS